jgi:glycosyltransferase involved in cell wall biosynthesis
LEGYPSLTNDYVRKKYGSKYPMVTFSLGVVLATKGLSAFLKGFYDSMYGVKTLREVDRIIALTEQEKEWCKGKDIDTKKIDIIPAGIYDSAFSSYDVLKAKEKYCFERYILFIGRMFYEKSPVHLVQALSKLGDEYKGLGVVFAGPDLGEAEKVKAKAKELGLENRIVYAGKVSEKEKYELLAGCEFFALPSKIEAQGIVFAEAWAQKKPVISTRAGAVPYVVKDKETGLLYDYGDINSLAGHIEYLLKNPKEARMMGEKGFEEADTKYRWGKVIDKIEAVFEKTIGESQKKRS